MATTAALAEGDVKAAPDSTAAATGPTTHSQSPAMASPILQSLQPPSLQPTVELFTPAEHAHLVLYLAALHGSCINHDGLTGSFAPPLHHEKLLAWWKVRLAASAVFLLLRPSSTPGTTKAAGADLIGAAMLNNHPAETSPHVAAIELLLVSPRHRHQGGERLLLEALEQQAVVDGRTLLADSSAAVTFTELGFTEAGRIPGFVVRPSSGEKKAQVIFYKDLTTRL